MQHPHVTHRKKGDEQKTQSTSTVHTLTHPLFSPHVHKHKNSDTHTHKKQSGAGKTTLLNVLSGQLKQTSGKVYYEGKEKENEKDPEDVMGFRGNAAIVPQNSHLLGCLTVRETLV